MNEKSSWNHNIISNNASFLQSWEWGELQKHLGRDVFRFPSNSFMYTAIRYPLPLHQSYLYIPHGPVGEWNEKNVETFLKEIKETAKSKKSFFIRIDPHEKHSDDFARLLSSAGFKKTTSVQPEETLLLDLSRSEETLLREMEHDTRYSIRTAEKRGVRVIRINMYEEKKKYFEIFWSLFEKTNTRHGLRAYPKRYYEEIFSLEGECRSEIFCALLDEEVIAMAVIISFGDVATYLYAASERGYGRYNAPTFLLWEIIRTAKKENKKYFDFWGISDTKKEWIGVTAFKKSFGGIPVYFGGTWDYALNTPKYILYNVLKRMI